MSVSPVTGRHSPITAGISCVGRPGVNFLAESAFHRLHSGQRGRGLLNFLRQNDWQLLRAGYAQTPLSNWFLPSHREEAQSGLEDLQVADRHHARLPYPLSEMEATLSGLSSGTDSGKGRSGQHVQCSRMPSAVFRLEFISIRDSLASALPLFSWAGKGFAPQSASGVGPAGDSLATRSKGLRLRWRRGSGPNFASAWRTTLSTIPRLCRRFLIRRQLASFSPDTWQGPTAVINFFDGWC